MSIYIHIGLPKTASTFIQIKYFKLLEEEKIIVYNPPEVIDIIRLLLKNYNENILDPYLSDLGSKLADSLVPYKGQKVIISHEGLTTLNYSFSYKRNLSFLSKFLGNAKIIIVLRDPCDWSISIYRQSIHQQDPKSVNRDSTKNDFEEKLNLVDYPSLINSYRKAFTDVKILFYEDFVEDKLLFMSKISEFIEITPIDILQSNEIVNRGLSSSAINFLIVYSRILKFFNLKIPYYGKKDPSQNSPIKRGLNYYFSWISLRTYWQRYIDKFLYLDFNMKKSDIFSKKTIIKINKEYNNIRENNNNNISSR